MKYPSKASGTPAHSSKPNQLPGVIQYVVLITDQPDGLTSPAVPDEVTQPTGFLDLQTCAELPLPAQLPK